MTHQEQMGADEAHLIAVRLAATLLMEATPTHCEVTWVEAKKFAAESGIDSIAWQKAVNGHPLFSLG